MHLYVEENRLVSEIRARFPVEAELTDQWLIERGYDRTELDEMAYPWIEAFADRTTDAVKLRDVLGVQKQTSFLAEQYQAGPATIRAIIDVAYAENIMWNASDADKVWAWTFIAKEIRQLYQEMWGCPKL